MGDAKKMGPLARKRQCYASLLFRVRRSVFGNSGIVGIALNGRNRRLLSWHQSSTDVAVRRSAPQGYSTIDCPRPGCGVDGRWSGGILIVHHDTLRVRRIPLVTTPTTFEALAVAVSSSRGPLTVLAIYDPAQLCRRRPISANLLCSLSSSPSTTHSSSLLVT